MPAMKTYEVIVNSAAVLDLEEISLFVAGQYRIIPSRMVM